ncbi:MAG: Uma2 family endonuclease [Lewinellaceae bacterium]|nr:Uma2 family endonuclease [Lewinellaceae bacterium]
MLVSSFPVSLADRTELNPGLVRLPASWDEYLDLLEVCEYAIEFEDNEIILMSIASNPHEAIVINIAGILFQLLGDNPDYFYAGSNRHIFIPEFEADYAPDAHVVQGKPVEHTLRKGLTANLNPAIIFEVLSPSTREHDLGTKLLRYKKIPSVRQIIYIEQTQPAISVYTRIGDSNRWENEDFDALDQSLLLEGQPVAVHNFYKKIIFEGIE